MLNLQRKRMGRIIRNSFVILLTLGAVVSCETEFDSYVQSDPIPVVFGVINPDDSLYQIRLSRSFVGEGNALDHAKISDSIYFEQAEVILETYRSGDLFQAITLEKTRIEDRVDGIFSSSPNYMYQTSYTELFIRGELFEALGIPYQLDLRLSVILPNYPDTVRGETRLISPPKIINPKSQYQKIYLFGEIPFHMEWVHTVGGRY